ncbi:MAG: response regulator [Thermodesulfobacteriota bacterium]
MAREKAAQATGKKALVVDNQPVILKLMQDFLTHEGYTVETAVDSLRALEVLERFTPEVMFVDLIMPHISGDKLCRVVRSMPAFRDVYIVVLSGVAAEEEVDFVGFGADACIAKGPFTKVKEHILHVLARRESGRYGEAARAILGLGDIYKREITKELLTSKRHFEIVLRNIEEGIIEFTAAGRIIFANHAAVVLTGIPEERLLASEFTELFKGPYKRAIRFVLKKLGEQPQEIGEDTPVILGERRLLLNFLPIEDEQGRTTIVILRDITRRKEVEEQLLGYRQHLEKMVVERTAELARANDELKRQIAGRKQAEKKKSEAEQEWAKTFDAIGDVITIQDTDMRIVRVNRAASRILGKAPEELIGSYCYEIFRGDSQPCPGCPEATSLEDGKTHSAEITHAKLGRTFLVSVAPILDEEGRCTSIAHFAKDITEQKQLAVQLQQAQKMQAIGTLAGGIAHDFNNILGAVLGYTDLALLEIPEENQVLRERLEAVLHAGMRAKGLVGQILAFSRQSETRRDPLEIGPIVKEALKLLRASLPATIEIRQEIGRSPAVVLADPVQLHQVLMNLCTNASHAMRQEGGTLTVRLDEVAMGADLAQRHPDLKPGSYIRLTVRDTGHGIEPSVMARIFEPFFTTKEVGEGTGMGLAVVHGIVKEHGGAIEVSSEAGEGTSFAVYFPRYELAPPEVPAVPELPLPRGSERVLFVDDEPVLARLGEVMLGRLGYRVAAFTSSVEALQALKKQPSGCDLVVTDLTMPRMTGLELTKRIRALRPELPVLLCTGYSEAAVEEAAKAIGIDHCLRKPLVLRELAMAVRETLDGRGAGKKGKKK